MTEAQANFTEQGKGKIVTLYFPENTEADRGEIIGSLQRGLGIQMGYLWGTSKIVEFEWGPGMDETAVNRELNRLRGEFPALQIRFGENSAITM